jgi:transcriptional regulator with XRE-family HTH domain
MIDSPGACWYVVTTLQKGAIMTFGERVRGRRKELRLGLREFALRVGMDPGNLSKIERGRLSAPQSPDILNRICRALEWEPDSEPASALKDLAFTETGQIPEEILSDEVVMSKMPLLLRTVRNKKLDEKELDRLIEMIRDA